MNEHSNTEFLISHKLAGMPCKETENEFGKKLFHGLEEQGEKKIMLGEYACRNFPTVCPSLSCFPRVVGLWVGNVVCLFVCLI